MEEQTHQLQEQVKGVEGQLAAIERQHEILSTNLVGLRKLLADQLVAATTVSDAEQNLSIVEGRRSELNAAIALARAKRAELGSQMAELRAQRMSEAAEEQREVQARIAELAEKQIAASRRVEQLVLTAPADGTVTDLQVRTVGGVVTASETLMTVVPTDDRLIAEVKLQPKDISNVRVGQRAELHFTSIGGASAPQFAGTVSFVAPDVVVEERTGASYFVVRVEIGEPLNDAARDMVTVGAGTPVEVFLLTEARTVLEYIAKPIFDQARRAFR
jgi:HlyD family secretion protein